MALDLQQRNFLKLLDFTAEEIRLFTGFGNAGGLNAYCHRPWR
jgi:hypothetical protein